MEKKKILMVSCTGLGKGGVQQVIMGIVKNFKCEFDFDITIFNNEYMHFENEFSENGQIYKINFKDYNNILLNRLEHFFRIFRLYFEMLYILKKQGPYDVIHCHNIFLGGVCNFAAYCAGVPIRISHSHSISKEKPSFLGLFFNKLLRVFLLKFSNVKIGCSKIANEYLYGPNEKNAFVVNNSIDFEKFNIDKYSSRQSDYRFIHIGRYNYVKNQMFLLDVFKHIHDKLSTASLTLIGFGEDEEKIKLKIIELGISNIVNMLPYDTNIPFFLSQSNYMIFPSRHEGFGIVLLEAQAMNVPCFVSDTIPFEADLGLCTFIPLELGAQKWADIIINDINCTEKKSQIRDDLLKKFEVKNVMQQYRDIYNGKKFHNQ